MAFRYLDKDGALSFWTNIKNYILSKIPTKTSELTNDSGFLTQHQSLSNYVTLNSNQTITAIKTITGGNQGKMVFKNPDYNKGDANESGVIVSRLYFGNGASYDGANGVLSTSVDSSGNSVVELCAINNTANNSSRASLILSYDKSASSRLLKSWGNFLPYVDNTYTLGNSSSVWKECYCNAYYLGTTAFGDIVTHNASEFLTSHQSLSSCVKNNVTNNQTIKSTAITRSTAPSSAQTFGIAFSDNNNKYIGNIYGQYDTDKSTYVGLYAYKGTTTLNSDNASVRVGYDASGNAYTYAPTPATADNSTQIATTAFVKAQGYLTSHQSLANYLTKTTNVSEMGRYIDLHYDNATSKYDYDARIYVNSQGTAAGGGELKITASKVTAGTFNGSLTGNVTGNCSGSSGSCTGNSATATQFSANTTVALTGDATGTSAGSKKGWSVPVTLANSGVTAGTYGPSADVTGNNNATISVPEITVDAKGRVTSVTNRTYTSVNTDTNTDTKVTQTVTTANSNYPVLLCATADATTTGTTTSRFSAGLAVNARYSSISMTNKYDTANTKGVRDSTKGYLNGDIIFKCYDDSEMGRIHCESSKNGYQQTYMQARSYIKNGAISPEGTATTCYITVRVRDNGSKTIYTDGSWENSLTPYANETYDIGTSSLRWMRCYCKNFYGSYVDIAGRYIGNEASTNGRSCLYLKANRDTDGKSGLYVTKFRQNRAQGSMGNSDSVFLSHDILENETRTNAGFVESYSNWTNDVPGDISVYSAIATRNLGTSNKPWTNAYITNLILNGNAFNPTSIDGIGTIRLLAYEPTSTTDQNNSAGITKSGSSLYDVRMKLYSTIGHYGVFDSTQGEFSVIIDMHSTQSGTWKVLQYISADASQSGAHSFAIGMWVKIA